MSKQLAEFIHTSAMADTHEHLYPEQRYLEEKPDALRQLLEFYLAWEMGANGATNEAVQTLIGNTARDPIDRFRAIEKAWNRIRVTGYGEAVRLGARKVYGVEDLRLETLPEIYRVDEEFRGKPGAWMDILSRIGRLDHVQVNHLELAAPDRQHPTAFFMQDLSWEHLASGRPNLELLAEMLGRPVESLSDLRQAMEGLAATAAPHCVAMKSQHAYNRTLEYHPRPDSEAETAFREYLKNGESTSLEATLCLGDWCLERGAELSFEHNLPFKIHCGYKAGNNYMNVLHLRAGYLCPLLVAHPKAQFVLMHTAYPYGDELVAMAKHFGNLTVDLCWAWSLDPYSTMHFVRQFIHSAAAHRLLVFGGDTIWPVASVGFAEQARVWLNRTLQAELADGYLSEEETLELAERFLMGNANELFDLDRRKAAWA